ncbi:MAG: type II toxin-antitoxin system Phd/YefM family antitoxin [Desulfarculales bacterium]|nr:type II toxin-antitoxin system Phd/YefM family antitoxin [Desulfarculales bacterium]
MPQIIPIRDLKKTSEISELCRKAKQPIFITKNGYGDMVIMSMETYERTMFANDVYRALEQGEQSIKAGDTMDAFDSLREVKKKACAISCSFPEMHTMTWMILLNISSRSFKAPRALL